MDQRTNVALERSIAQQDQVPETLDVLLPVSRISLKQALQILLLDKPRRSQKISFRQPVLLPEVWSLASDFFALSAEVAIIHRVVAKEYAPLWQPKLDQVIALWRSPAKEAEKSPTTCRLIHSFQAARFSSHAVLSDMSTAGVWVRRHQVSATNARRLDQPGTRTTSGLASIITRANRCAISSADCDAASPSLKRVRT